MEELKNSGLFEIVGPEYKEQQEREQREERKRLLKEERKIIAKKLKEKGMDIATIKEMTGQSESAIKKL